MIGFALTTIATALSLLITDLVVPGVDVATFPAAIIAGLAIGLLNSTVRPVLAALSLPITFLTLGLFSLVVNGLCFWLASVLVPGFVVSGAIAFLLGPVILSLVNTFLSRYFAERNLGAKISTNA
jgi:putative membrane protein